MKALPKTDRDVPINREEGIAVKPSNLVRLVGADGVYDGEDLNGKKHGRGNFKDDEPPTNSSGTKRKLDSAA